MEAQSQNKKPTQSEVNTSTMSEGEKFWEKLQAQGYSNSKVGQGFVASWSKPKKNTSRTKKS